jgi:hypothetical protein
MPTYVAVIEGSQPIPIPPEIANDDAAVATVLTPYYPEAAEAELSRDEKDGVVTITVTPRGKTKGALTTSLSLSASPARR